MSKKERRQFLDRHYAGRTRWREVRLAEPGLTFLDWIDREFSDRRELGVVQGDLKHLDLQAYQTINNWQRPQRDGTCRRIPESFGLPTKEGRNDAIFAAGGVPTVADVKAAAGESPGAALLRRRYDNGRARIHRNLGEYFRNRRIPKLPRSCRGVTSRRTSGTISRNVRLMETLPCRHSAPLATGWSLPEAI